MIKSVNFVTRNSLKVEVAKNSLSKYGINVEQLNIDTPEIQSTNTEEVVKYSVKFAAEKTQKPVIKVDVGLHIEALNGFPGPFVKFINQWLNADQLSKLFKGEKNKKAYFIDALGYCEPGKEPVCFVSRTYGNMIDSPKGTGGSMVDSLFIPDGYIKTIAELSKEEFLKLFDNDRYSQLAKYLKEN